MKYLNNLSIPNILQKRKQEREATNSVSRKIITEVKDFPDFIKEA
jgi:hypothetical protein